MARDDDRDYTARDYDSTLDALVARIRARQPAFDTSPGNPDVALLEALAYLGDRLGYLANSGVTETLLRRARLRQSVIDVVALIDYQLATATPAVAPVELTLPRAYPDATTFAAGTRVETDDGAVAYELDAPVTIPPGETTGRGTATQGETHVEAAVGVPPDDAPAGQRVALAAAPLLADSERVTVGAEAWTRVDAFAASAASAAHYVVERDADDRAVVVFGDGVTGRRPAPGAAIAVRYRVGGGVAGRVRRGRLTRLVGAFATTGGTPVEPAVTNPQNSSGGDDREPLARAKVAAPRSLRGTARTIAREDYEIHAMEVPGVARALCHTRNEDATIRFNDHRVYVVPTGGGVANAALLAAVAAHLTTGKPRGALDALHVVPALYAPLTVAATLVLRRDAAPRGADRDAVVAAARDAADAATRAFFAPAARDRRTLAFTLAFGTTAWRSQLIAALQRLATVDHLELTLPAADAALDAHRFPTLAGAPAITVLVPA